MAKTGLNEVTTAQTFQTWLDRTNEIVDILGTDALTASALGDTTTGDAALIGSFTANTVTATDSLRTNVLSPKVGSTSITISSPVSINSSSQTAQTLISASGPRSLYSSGSLIWSAGFENASTNRFIINTGSGNVKLALSSSGDLSIAGSISINGSQVTASAAELNILDGVTATTAELNYTAGATSSIQSQIDDKYTATTQTTPVWQTGTSTTESLVSPAKVSAAALDVAKGSFNLSPGGWQELPSGLYIQWGSVTGVNESALITVNFPTPFPNQVFIVNVTPNDNRSSDDFEVDLYSVAAKPISNSQFTIMQEGSTSGNNQTMMWMALGR